MVYGYGYKELKDDSQMWCELGYRKKNYISTKSDVLVHGVANLCLTTCIMSCYVIITLQVHAGIIANALLGDTLVLRPIVIHYQSSADLAPDSSEEVDSPRVDAYGVDYKRPAMLVFGSVETPVQRPREIRLIFWFSTGPDHTDNNSTSNTRSYKRLLALISYSRRRRMAIYASQMTDYIPTRVNVPIMEDGTTSVRAGTMSVDDVKQAPGLASRKKLVVARFRWYCGVVPFVLLPESHPDLALDSSEGVVSQPKLSMPTYGSVKTPIQQPQGRPLISSAGPDHADDTDSTSSTRINIPWLLVSSARYHKARKLAQAQEEKTVNMLRALLTCCFLSKPGVLIHGVAYTLIITSIIDCLIISFSRPLYKIIKRVNCQLIKPMISILDVLGVLPDTPVGLAHARKRMKCHIRSILLNGQLARFELRPESRPDLALYSSEEGDTTLLDAYGVVSQPTQPMPTYGSVETPPTQQPEGRPLLSSERLEQFLSASRASNQFSEGPDHADNASTSSAASNTLASIFARLVATEFDVFTDEDDNEADLVITVPIMGAMRVHVEHVPRLGRKKRPVVTRTAMKRHNMDGFGLGSKARPDLALDSSEQGDSATADAHGVISQAKQCMPICSSVETPPMQQPQGRPLSSRVGPDDADMDSTSSTTNNTPWLLASSAPCHMSGDASQMTDYVPTHDGDDDDTVVGVPNMGVMRVHGTGSVRTATMCLDNVKHVPSLGKKNLVSTGLLARGGCTVTLAPSGCRITNGDHTVVGEAHFTDDNLLQVDFLRVPSSSSPSDWTT